MIILLSFLLSYSFFVFFPYKTTTCFFVHFPFPFHCSRLVATFNIRRWTFQVLSALFPSLLVFQSYKILFSRMFSLNFLHFSPHSSSIHNIFHLFSFSSGIFTRSFPSLSNSSIFPSFSPSDGHLSRAQANRWWLEGRSAWLVIRQVWREARGRQDR